MEKAILKPRRVSHLRAIDFVSLRRPSRQGPHHEYAITTRSIGSAPEGFFCKTKFANPLDSRGGERCVDALRYSTVGISRLIHFPTCAEIVICAPI
jgi:hypothetical protein